MKKTILGSYIIYYCFGVLLASIGFADAVVAVPEKIGADSCIDSDDGIDYYTKGTVDAIDAGSRGHYNDLCFDGKDQLREWYCMGMQPAEIIKDCKNGCQDGACLPKTNEKPDLAVDSIRIDPENPGESGKICLYAEIKNIGGKDISSSDMTVWTYINNSHISSTFFGNTLRIGEHLEKELLCSKYGENTFFRKGSNSVWVVIDPSAVNIIDESDETNNGMNTSFEIPSEGFFAAGLADWDVSIKFDIANKGPIYPFRGLPGVVGETYYDRLDGTDDVYRETAYANTCPSSWDADPDAKRALGWYAEKKRMENGDYRVLIRGTAPADCSYSSPGESRGELSVNLESGWKIKEIVKCNAQASNKGQDVKCEAGIGYLMFSAGSDCGGCCACADSGSLDIEVILAKDGASSVIDQQVLCSDDDGGRNIFKKGDTTYLGQKNTDHCASEDKLIEYYCNDNKVGSVADRACENGCIDGACLKDKTAMDKIIPDDEILAEEIKKIADSGSSYVLAAVLGVALSIAIITAVALSKKM